MSTMNNFLRNNHNDCCRTCSGNIYGQFAITAVPTDYNNWDYKEIAKPEISKNCDKTLKTNGDTALNQALKNRLSSAFETKINNLLSVGYYLERGKIFKLGCSFEATVCVDGDKIDVSITAFSNHTFGF